MESENGRMRIVMLPYLAHGHISPFVELAKHLTKTSCFKIYLCSTPINLDSIRNRVLENENIQLVELHLPSSPDLPPRYHSTNGLPDNLNPIDPNQGTSTEYQQHHNQIVDDDSVLPVVNLNHSASQNTSPRQGDSTSEPSHVIETLQVR